jgi:hypothetical protein
LHDAKANNKKIFLQFGLFYTQRENTLGY